MINTMGPLLNSWFALLNGNLTYSGQPVQVVKADDEVEEITSDHYVLLRAESGLDRSNKRSFVDDLVVIVDVVTRFTNNIDGSVAENIDGQIGGLIKTSPRHIGLGAQSGMQIVTCIRETFNYLPAEKDDTYKYYRKVSRYNHRVLQTA